jgi:hypothetical protein
MEIYCRAVEIYHLLIESFGLSVEICRRAAEIYYLSAEICRLAAETYHFSVEIYRFASAHCCRDFVNLLILKVSPYLSDTVGSAD